MWVPAINFLFFLLPVKFLVTDNGFFFYFWKCGDFMALERTNIENTLIIYVSQFTQYRIMFTKISKQNILKTFKSLQYLATWWEEMTHWKRFWCWERLKEKGEGGGRGWDGEIASPNQRTWIWADSGRLWRTGKPGVL